jgi:hypothetical protein
MEPAKLPSLRRYGCVTAKLEREVVLLRSTGCRWGCCTFCDYQDDMDADESRCAAFNHRILAKVKGTVGGSSGILEVLDSASFVELPEETLQEMVDVCLDRGITEVIAEQYWGQRRFNPGFRRLFDKMAVTCTFIAGVETFNEGLREGILCKGMANVTPKEVAEHYQWVNLLLGFKGQTLADIEVDIILGLRHFERVNLCVFTPNRTSIQRDPALVEAFYQSPLFAALKKDCRVEILDPLDQRAPDTLDRVGYPEAEA